MNSIAFIDRSVSDSQVLAAGTVSGTEVVLLDSAADGIEQISLRLRDRSFKEVHIISHGAPGCLMLGNALLSWETLDRLQAQIEMWGKSLAKNAQILIYGCRVASGAQGRSFVERLSELITAKIAASANFTGSKELGGDWELEVTTGEITAAKAFDSEVMAAYSYIFNLFSPPRNYETGGSVAQFVAVSNLNGDTFPDLVVANQGSNNISILLGNATGSFSPASNYDAGIYPTSVAVGNFNNDTFPDLAVANQGSSNISILLANGTGNFSPAINYDAGLNPNSVAVGNFNNDTYSDLVTANSSSNNVSILLGNGTGSFSPATNYNAGSTPSSVVVGNFNNDTFSDLAVANFNSNNISILLGNATGSFSPATNYNAGLNSRSVIVGDFNLDSFPDLAVANQGSNNISILLGNGTGSFGFATNYNLLVNPTSLAVGDFNQDLFPDLAVGSESSNTISILLGNGTGIFSFNPTDNYYNLGLNQSSVAVGKFNSDTLTDVVAVSRNSSNLSVLYGRPSVNFGAPNYTMNEGGTQIFNVPITLSGVPSEVRIQVKNSSAESGKIW